MTLSRKNKHKEKVKRPSFFWMSTEAGRALTEYGLSIPYKKYLLAHCHGDGHPVIIFPGFVASDRSTIRLRRFLRDLGYDARPWDMGRNYGHVDTIALLEEKVQAIYNSTGEKVSLIGWSLGGVFARQVAKSKAAIVRQVCTLGSPFRGITQPNNASWMYNIITGGKRVIDIDPNLLADLKNPAPVPTTAIYSKQDGVVPWQVCMEEVEDELHQNIQVRGSHLGFSVNPAVLNVLADRLQYSEENWCPFVPNSYMQDKLLYPAFNQ